jgi:hypothetical protein
VAVAVTDGTNTGTASFTWTVINPNAPTVTPPANQTNNEGDVVSGVAVTATGGDGSALTFSATSLPPGLTINATTGVISGTLTSTSAGTYTVAVEATDGTNTGSATFQWTVSVAPPVVTPPANQTNNVGDVVTGVTVTATGGDGNALAFSATGLPPGLTINATTGVISGTLTAASAGTFNVEVHATDGTNTGNGSFTWTVLSPNVPVVTPPADQTNNEGDIVTGVTVTATGGDGSPLTFSATNLPPGLTIDATTGVISGTLTGQSAGNYTVAVSASDGTNVGHASFTWAVADVTTPVVTPPADQSGDEDSAVSGVFVTATDADGDTLTFGATNLPPGLTINPTTGEITGTLAAGSAGTYTVTVSASDGFNTGTANFTWTVINPLMPIVTPPADQSNNEGDAVSGVFVTATGGDGNALAFSATNLPPGLAINATTGEITGTLTGQSAGTYTVGVSVTDGSNTGTASFTWTVADVTTPVVTPPANQSNNEGDVVAGVPVTATDADGDTLTFSAANLPNGLTIDATTGVISGTLAAGSAGTYTVTVSASDGFNTGSATFTWTVINPLAPVVTPPADQTNNEGDAVSGVFVTATGGDGNPLTFSATNLPPGLVINATTGEITGTLTGQSAGHYVVDVSVSDGTNTGSATFNWTVADITTPVVTPPADQTSNEGEVVAGVPVTATDADGDTLTFSATNLPNGLTIDATTGVISGTLAAGSAGTYTVTVDATDGFNIGSATFTWTVTAASPPVVTPPADQTNNEGDAVSGVFVTATGGDGNPLTYTATNLPAGLTINATTGEISGTLTGQSAGTYTVTVSANDGLNTGSATFTWTVADITTPVVTAPADQSNNEGDVVAGVPVTATDADGDTLAFSATNLPSGLTINATTGVISGTLAAGSAGTYTVTVDATDGFNVGTATFTWTVTAASPPVVTPPADQTNNQGDVVSGVFATATGGDGNPLTFTATNLPPGLSINPTTGEITGTLTAASAGAYAVTVSATDGVNTGSADFHWVVNNPNAPVVTPPADQTNNHGDVVSGVFVTATGGDGNALTFTATNLPPGLTINPTTGEITGTLTPTSAGVYTVNVQASDGTNTGSASFTWTVT